MSLDSLPLASRLSCFVSERASVCSWQEMRVRRGTNNRTTASESTSMKSGGVYRSTFCVPLLFLVSIVSQS